MVAILPILGYLFGCINGAYYTGKMIDGSDIRDFGSSNAGARNAGRTYGRSAFILTVILDVFKTIIPLSISQYGLDMNTLWLTVIALSILVGHIWPIQLQFSGGKGVVVYLATAAILAPLTVLVCGLCLGIGLLVKKSFTLAGMIGLFSIPFTLFFWQNYQLTAAFFLLLLVVLIAHRRRK